MNTTGQPFTVTELCDLLSASKAELQAQCALIDTVMKRLRVMEQALVEIAAYGNPGGVAFHEKDVSDMTDIARTALKP